MKTAAVYEHDSYKKSLKSKIIDIRKGDRTELILEETIFYPEGGGQPADKGYLEINHSKVRVMDVQEKDEICLQIEEGKEVQIGDEVEQFIDWDFRLTICRIIVQNIFFPVYYPSFILQIMWDFISERTILPAITMWN